MYNYKIQFKADECLIQYNGCLHYLFFLLYADNFHIQKKVRASISAQITVQKHIKKKIHTRRTHL